MKTTFLAILYFTTVILVKGWISYSGVYFTVDFPSAPTDTILHTQNWTILMDTTLKTSYKVWHITIPRKVADHTNKKEAINLLMNKINSGYDIMESNYTERKGTGTMTYLAKKRDSKSGLINEGEIILQDTLGFMLSVTYVNRKDVKPDKFFKSFKIK